MVQQYLDHSKKILTDERANFKFGSKGMGLISLFGYQNSYDLRQGFPLLTTKKLSFKTIAHELIWFMKGETNLRYLAQNNVHIWDDNAFDYNLGKMIKENIFSDKTLERYSDSWKAAKGEYVQRVRDDEDFAQRFGELGPVYGSQWRKWRYADENGEVILIDQLQRMIDELKKNPRGKGNIVTAWNPGETPKMALRPCHVMYQATANEEGELEMGLYQRSCDMFLGVPFNIASYAMLTQVVAQQVDLKPKTFVHSFGDAHFYTGDGDRAKWYKNNLKELRRRIMEAKNSEDYLNVLSWINSSVPAERKETEGQDHVTAIIEQLSRTPKQLPTLEIANKPLDKLTIDDFVLKEYDPYPTIKRVMAV